MKKYEIFSTTADVGIRFYGRDFAELYQHAVAGLDGLLCGGKSKSPAASSRRRFNFRGDSVENVLVNLLAEVLSLAYQNKLRVVAMTCLQADSCSLAADLHLGDIEGEAEIDIKAVTYHKLSVSEKGGIKKASVVFDI